MPSRVLVYAFGGWLVLATVLGIAGLLTAAAGQVGSAPEAEAANSRTRAVAESNSAKPTIVLVHGAWADSGSWDRVVQRLQQRGYTVYAPPNPLRGLPNDSATIADFLATIPRSDRPGRTLLRRRGDHERRHRKQQREGARLPGCLCPAAGQDDRGAHHRSELVLRRADLSTVFNFAPFPGAPGGVYDAYVKQSVFPGCFANGLPASEGAVLAATQRPLATSALADQSGVPAWATIASWAVVGTEDHVIPEADQLKDGSGRRC